MKKIEHPIPTTKTGLSNPSTNQDTIKKVTSGPKSYKEVITEKAVTDKGLFTVHKIDQRYFFEIEDSLLNRDILVVNRISKAAAEIRPSQGFFGYAGDQIGGSVIQFSYGPETKLYLKKISFEESSNDSSENGMLSSVRKSNLNPIVAAFDIKAFSKDSASVIIDMTDFMKSDTDVFYFNHLVKKQFSLGSLQSDKSYIVGVKSFPLNTEISALKTYSTGETMSTFELNSSLVLLPAQPMKPRYKDERVGYFSTDYRDYDGSKIVKLKRMITRWKLEPKEEDIGDYLKGKLVEPKKPIVYYIDPTTPKKWVPYLIQGVNDWQKAFEKAGFKNAIYALEAPINNPEWSLEDARHSAIVYKPSHVANASGPHVHDPRSGEILESHINWYHNVIQLLHDWYMVQASPNDPRARKMEFEDDLMGQLIRFVCAHEVGHTLGLMHNFGASSTIPVEKLRDKKWVEENGFCPSIMDYARFNYVAQPEDKISPKGIFPRIGVYDEWAIEWGYKWLPNLKNETEEKTFMNQWIISRLEKDNKLWFGNESTTSDPRSQAEAVGDNAMQASFYGIKNLQRIMPMLTEWTKEANSDYQSLERTHKQIIIQFQRYLLHVAMNIGGITITPKTIEQKGSVIEFTPREQQKSATKFLLNEIFNTPTWILNKNIFSLTGNDPGLYNPLTIQRSLLGNVLSQNNFINLLWFQTNHPDSAYTIDELLNDLERGIWRELNSKLPIDIYRRNLQKAYVERLIMCLYYKTSDNPHDIALYGPANFNTDIPSLFKEHIRKLIIKITDALRRFNDGPSIWHLKDVRERLTKALEPNSAAINYSAANNKTTNEIFGDDPSNLIFNLCPNSKNSRVMNWECWEYDLKIPYK